MLWTCKHMLKDTSTHPHTLKSAPCLSSSSLLRFRVRLGTIVAQPGADGEVRPEGASQVLHPLVICPSSQLLQPPIKVWRPQAPVGWASFLPVLPPPAGDALLCSCQERRRQRERCEHYFTLCPSCQNYCILHCQDRSCVMLCVSRWCTYRRQEAEQKGDEQHWHTQSSHAPRNWKTKEMK